MKKSLFALGTLALLAACSSTPAGDPTVAAKRAERDSLKAVYADLGQQLREVEEWLTEHDSTLTRNLPVVTQVKLEPKAFAHYIDVHGNVKADKSAALFAAGGRVRAILVNAGDHVHKGQLLLTMDNDVVDKQIEQAEAQYDLANTNYERQKRLWDQRIGSEMQYLQARTQKEQAEAGLATLREQQRLSNVTAPFDGTVDEVMARVGDMASPQMPVIRVIGGGGVQLEADVPENYLRTIREGVPVKVEFPMVGEQFDAKLDHVGEYIDPANRTFKVVVDVPKGESYMRPNLLSDISILDLHLDSAVVVPDRAILEDVDGNSYLFTLTPKSTDEAVAGKTYVKRVSTYKGRTVVTAADSTKALPVGGSIVDEGAKNLSDGQSVRIANK